MSEKENLFSEEVVEESAEETIEEAVEETAEDAVEDAVEDVEEATEEVAEDAEEVVAEAVVKKELPLAAKIAIQLASVIVISIIVSVLTVNLMPKFKYNKAMSLIKKGKLQEAYDILQQIDGSYKKAEEELKRFVKFPDEQNVTESYGSFSAKIKTKTGKNSYTLEIEEEGQKQTREFHFDEKGNVVKQVVKDPSGSAQVTETVYDANGNVIKETVTTTTPGSEESQSVSEQNSKNYKLYYVGR